MAYLLFCASVIALSMSLLIFSLVKVYIPAVTKVDSEIVYIIDDINKMNAQLKEERDELYLKLSGMNNEIVRLKKQS